MKRLNYIILVVFTVCFVSSCKKEDVIQVQEDTRTTLFLPDPSATDQESVIRRTFYAEEKSYLLFNDTLTHQEIGVDYNGDKRYFTEVVNLRYTVGGNAVTTLQIKPHLYTNMEEKLQALDFLKTYVLPKLNPVLRPYSWLLVREIESTDVFEATSYPSTVLNQRCLAVALGDIAYFSEEEKIALADQIVAVAMGYKLSFLAGALDSFYEVSQELYGGTVPFDDYTEEANLAALNQNGFIVQKWIIEGFWLDYGAPPTREEDLGSYIKLIFNNTDEQVNAQYAEYPIVRQKYKILKDLLLELDFID